MKDLGFEKHYLSILAPVDKADNSWASPYVDLADALNVTFLVSTGTFTFGASTTTITFTAEASSAGTSNASEVQVPFRYRLSGAVGTDSWGAVTAVAASTGVALTDQDGSKLLLIEIDPAVIPALNSLGRYVRLVATKSATLTADLFSVVAMINPRHAATTMIGAS